MSNAANAKPQVEVELDRLRKACFDMNALCEFEKVTGKTVYLTAKYGLSQQPMNFVLWYGQLCELTTQI
jgi:hypothetical protein